MGYPSIDSLEESIKKVVTHAHNEAVKAGWWKTIEPEEKYTIPALLCLIHSEISEAMEGHRKDLMDDKLPHRKMLEVELADAFIRIADLSGGLGLDLPGAVVEKLQFNASRADHKPENRAKENGKAY